MHAVIFEVQIKDGAKQTYLDIANQLRTQLIDVPGFISIERFQSLVNKDKLLSLSYWEDETAIKNWKANFDHKQAQTKGRQSIFKDYRICVVKIKRDYTLETSSFEA